MKLLATDYDGTFKSDIKNLHLNKKSIKKFREQGNKFAIITGRSFNSIKKEIEKYNIEYDYLSCNDGSILFDSTDNIISSFPLSDEDLDLIYLSALYKFGAKDIHLYNERSRAHNLENILELYIRFQNVFEAQIFKKYLNKRFNTISCRDYLFHTFVSNNYTKADAVSIIQQLENIEDDDVYTVGDNKNDLEMLKKFNGYKMLTSYPSLWLEPLPITREVHTLVKKISKK